MGMRERLLLERINLSNIIAVVAVLAAVSEAAVAAIQVDNYKKAALFSEQVRVCSTLIESANEFRGAAIALQAADAGEAGAAKARIDAARERLTTTTRRIETTLDALDLLLDSQTERQAAELARQVDQHLLTLDQAAYTPADLRGWVDRFDGQVGRAVTACHKDLLH